MRAILIPLVLLLLAAAAAGAHEEDVVPVSSAWTWHVWLSVALSVVGTDRLAESGYFRIVFLSAPEILNTVYDEMAAFTRDFLAR